MGAVEERLGATEQAVAKATKALAVVLEQGYLGGVGGHLVVPGARRLGRLGQNVAGLAVDRHANAVEGGAVGE